MQDFYELNQSFFLIVTLDCDQKIISMYCILIEMADCVCDLNLKYKKVCAIPFLETQIFHIFHVFFVFIKIMSKEKVTSYDIPPAPYVIVFSCD